MDQKELQQKIAEYYQKLPKEAQEIFAKMEWLSSIEAISKKYELNDEQVKTLATETVLALLGVIHTDEYENILKSELNLSQESASSLISDLNKMIIGPVKKDLEAMFEKNVVEFEENNIREDIDKRFTKVSPELQDAIKRSGYEEIVLDIAKKHALDVYQTGVLGESVIREMTGEIMPDKFEGSLKELNLTTETSKQIVEELNERLFKPIRERLSQNTQSTKAPVKTEEEREELLKKIEKPEPVTPKAVNHPVINQKLSGSFNLPKKETDHSLPNISSSENKPEKKYEEDPYREPIE